MLVITRIPFQDAGHCFLIGGQLLLWWRFGCSYWCVDCFGSSGIAQARNCLSVYSQSPWVLMSQQDRELVVVDIIDVHDQQLSVPVLGNGRLCSRRSNLLSKALTPFHTGGWWWWTLKMSTTSNSLFHGQKLQVCLWQQACAVVFTRRTCGWSSHVREPWPNTCREPCREHETMYVDEKYWRREGSVQYLQLWISGCYACKAFHHRCWHWPHCRIGQQRYEDHRNPDSWKQLCNEPAVFCAIIGFWFTQEWQQGMKGKAKQDWIKQS